MLEIVHRQRGITEDANFLIVEGTIGLSPPLPAALPSIVSPEVAQGMAGCTYETPL